MGESFVWKCSVCDKVHQGLPDIAYDAPSHYYSLTEKDRGARAALNGDFCVVDGEAFYIRTFLYIPVHGYEDGFGWGVWSSLSEKNFKRYQETFWDDDQSKLGPMFSWFASSLPNYPETLSLRCNVLPQDDRERPLVKFDPEQDHPLVRDQLNGISQQRAISFASLVLHKH